MAEVMEYRRHPPVMDSEDRQRVWIGVVVAVTLIAIFSGLWVCIVLSHQSDERKTSAVVTACVNAGNLWIDDNCVPSGKR